MAELFIFSQDEQPLTILSEDTGLISTFYRIEVNSVPTTPFVFTLESEHPNAKYVKEENKVVFKDHEGDWRLMVIREIDDQDSVNGSETTATCEPVFLAELADHIIVDRRFNEQSANVALNGALEGTRWIGEVLVQLGLATTNFYYLSSIEAIWKIISVWGGELKDVVEFDEETNEILSCKIQLIQRLGAEHGQRFEIDHNISEIGRTILSYPKTALYGRGASLETDNGGNTRFIDFADVEWKTADGDPVDKPLGQKWVGDPEALQIYGYEYGTKHRFGIFSDQEYEDPEELLWATWQSLQASKQPEVNYRLSVDLFNENVNLGDTAQAVDRRFSRPIEIQTRVIAMEYDLLDIEGTMVVEMGQFINLDDDRLDRLEQEIERVGSRPQRVGNGSYPDIKPGTPVNVEAHGGIEVIQLYWDYDSAIYVKHYEVYGSQVQDFIPDSQHLLWRGQTSAFAHRVETDQVWYYRVRSVNYQGTPSDYSVQVEAGTHRVISDEILFDPELAARLRELSETAKLLADGTISLENLDQTIIAGNRIRGDLIAIEGTTYIADGVIGNAAIANGAIDRAKLGTAVVGEAQIEDLAVTDAKIASLNADKINAGAIRGIDIYGSQFRSSDGLTTLDIVGGNVRLRQNNGRYVHLMPEGIYGYYAAGGIMFQADRFLVTSSAFGTTEQNVYLASFNEARVVDYNDIPGDGQIGSYRYLPLRANGIYANFLNINSGGTGGQHIYLRPRGDGEVRATVNGTTDAYVPIKASGFVGDTLDIHPETASNNMYIRPRAGFEVRFTSTGSTTVYQNIRGARAYFDGVANNSGTYLYLGTNNEAYVTSVGMSDNDPIVWRPLRAAGIHANYIDTNGATNATHIYVRPAANGEARITARSTTDNYRPIRASDYLPPSSTRNSKKEIDVYSENVLDVFRYTSVYTFLYKWEDDFSKKRLGVMLDEVPDIIQSKSKDTLEMYSTIGYVWKGLKDTIRYVDDEFNLLSIENQSLKNKITVLEKKVIELEEKIA